MKQPFVFPAYCFFILIVLFNGCAPAEPRPLRIAVSKAIPADTTNSYVKFLRASDSTILIEEMYHRPLDSALMVLGSCDGLLLTGGTDIYPGIYGKEKDTVRCWEPDFKRDSLEFALLATALEKGMPVLGICRGHQLINVATGGSLIIDIPSDFDSITLHRVDEGYHCFHIINIEPGSLLHEITGVDSAVVNSAHHQAVEGLGNGLRAVAFAPNALIESVEWENRSNYPFLLGVQWHPERLYFESPLSGNISKRFIDEARNYQSMKYDE